MSAMPPIRRTRAHLIQNSSYGRRPGLPRESVGALCRHAFTHPSRVPFHHFLPGFRFTCPIRCISLLEHHLGGGELLFVFFFGHEFLVREWSGGRRRGGVWNDYT